MIGLYLDGKNYLLAEIKKKKKDSFTVDRLISYLDVKQLYIQPHKTIATGLKASEALIHPLSLNVTNKTKLSKILAFQSESLTFIETEKSLSIPIIKNKKSHQVDILFFTTTDAVLARHLGIYQKDGIDPRMVSYAPLALARYANAQIEGLSEFLILHLGVEETVFILAANHLPKKAYTLPFGSSHLSQENPMGIGKKQSNSLDLLDQMKHFVTNTLHAMGKKETLPLLLTGQIKQHRGALQTILSEIEGEVKVLPFSPMEEKNPELREFAIPIGLALDALAKDKSSLQFRTNQFTPAPVLKKSFLRLFTFLSICCLLSFASYFFTIKKQINALENLDLLVNEAMQKDYLLSHRNKAFDPSLPIETKLDLWEKALKQESMPFPYSVKVPLVTDILSWISHHPLLSLMKDVKLMGLHYTLEKYPKIGDLSEPYVVKVHLEISFPSTLAARKFHESLLKGEGPVDGDKEINWEMDEALCKTSFYLNPHYRYG